MMDAASQIILFGGSQVQVPSWVLPGASVDLDFANGLYFGDTLANLLSISRASNATDLLPSSASGYAYNTYGSNVLAISPTFGLLIFEARTNVLLNSTAPATQTTASLGTGTYTLWVNGSGSALASGGTATITGAAPATNGALNVITVTVAGTVTVTVTGSLNAFQLEANTGGNGNFGTSLIVTAGATATRAADAIQLTGSALTILAPTTNGWIIQQVNLQLGAISPAVMLQAIPGRDIFIKNTTQLYTSWNSANFNVVDGTPSWSGLTKMGLAWNATSTIITANGAAATTDATHTPDSTPTSQVFLGGRNGSIYMNGAVTRLSLSSGLISAGQLQTLTT